MKRSNQPENLLVVSTLLTIMIYSFFYTSHAAAMSSDSARPDALIQNSSKNSKIFIMISITAIATTTTTVPNQMKCQFRSAINLIPANPVNQTEFAVKQILM
jgi:uncharacterized membrane protein